MNKQKIIEACEQVDACEEEFERLKSAKNDKEFVQVLQYNIRWVAQNLQYDLIKDIPFDWDKLNGWDWSRLLIHQSQFHIHCDWGKLNGWDWRYLLIHHPQFSKHCHWDKLDVLDWKELLKRQPQFKKYKLKNFDI